MMKAFRNLFRTLLENRSWKTLKGELGYLEPFQIAELIDGLSNQEAILLFRLLSREVAMETFRRLPHEKQEEIIKGLATNSKKIAGLLNDLNPDDRTAFLEELPGEITQKLLQIMSPEERSITQKLLGYPVNSVGRLMTTEYVAVKPQDTIGHALEHIRKYGHDAETLNFIYVIDQQWKLLDDIRIEEIILASPAQKIEELIDYKFVSLCAFDDEQIVINTFKDYDRAALPIVDTGGTLLGIVTFDDVMDIVEEATTEDFYKFGSVQKTNIGPVKANVFYLYRKRIAWLLALVFMNIFSGAAIESFEAVLQSVVSLVFFLPLLIDSGGNAGSQSATLMIRSLATGEVKIKDWFRLLGKELLVSLLLGITMALGVSLVASFRAPEIIIVVALTMVLTVMVGSLIGLLLPFALIKLKKDPATASAPLITSISDITGVLIYFSIASCYFGF